MLSKLKLIILNSINIINFNYIDHNKIKANFIKLTQIDKNGNTALHIAVTSKDINNLEKLLKTNININAQNNYGQTALHLTVLSGPCYNSSHIINLLIKHNININIRDNNNDTALDTALKSSNLNFNTYLWFKRELQEAIQKNQLNQLDI